MKDDLLVNETSSTLTPVSTIVSLDLINPLDSTEYTFIEERTLTGKVDLKLTDNSATSNVIVSWSRDN